MACLTTVSWGATLSGSITNSTSKSGRLYVMLMDQNGGQASGYGTSIANVAANATNIPYTIKGIRPGTYSKVYAWLDTRGTGYPYSDSPVGSTNPGSPINVSGADISGLNFSVQGQGPQTLTAPPNLDTSPMDGGVLVVWDTPQNANGIEIAEKYNVYWGTNPDVGPGVGKTVDGGSRTDIPARDDGHFFIPLPNDTSYYFAVEAVLGGSSAISRTATPTHIGAPTGGHSVTVQINFKTPPEAPLLAVLSSNNGALTGRLITAPVQNQTITIPVVQDGTYSLYLIYDKNNNGYYDTGDVNYTDSDELTPKVSVLGANVTLAPLNMAVSRNLEAAVMTQTQFAGMTYYQLNFDFHGQVKRPAHVVINSGQQMTETSIGQNSWGSFSLYAPVTAIPKIGDSYDLTVTYTDGTTEPLTLTVANVFNKSPKQTYPIGNTAPSSIKPRFAWNTLSGLPNSAYMYRLTLQEANNYGDYLWEKTLTPDQVSVQYDGPDLTTGKTYNWGIEMHDKYGNRSSSWQQFTPQASGPSITTLETTTLPCGSTTPIIITGTGFNNTPNQNAVYFNNSLVAVTPTSASNTQLTVNLPACSTAPSTGPIIIATNGQTVASDVEFTPTFTYNYYVTDKTITGMSGVQVEVADKPSIPAVFSNVNGLFSLSGIPTGIPYRLKFSKANYMPVYSAFLLNVSDVQVPQGPSYGFSIAQQPEFTSWGIQAGKGVIRGRTRDTNSSSDLGGVTVFAYSSNQNSYAYYTVAYTDPNNPNALISGLGASTHTDGKYYVLNVEEGDAITVGGSIDNYNISPRVFIGQADAMGQSSINGAPAVSISGFTPSSAVPGSIITINGTNFSTTTSSNIVCFGMICTTPGNAILTQLTVAVPCGAQNGPISVTVNGQNAFSADSFTIPAPTITNIFPTQGPLNAGVTITGTNFGGCPGDQVRFTNNLPTFASWSPTTQVTANAPFGATTGPIRVTTGGGTATSGTFTVLPSPAVSSATPDSGPIGTVITVTGNFYDLNPAIYNVQVDGFAATVNSVGANTLTFTIPNGIQSFAQWSLQYYGQQYWNAGFTVTPKLAVAISGTGSGTVNSVPSGSICNGAWCRNYDSGAAVTLTASPSIGSEPGVWGGDCAGSASSPCILTMNSNKAVTANFLIQDNARLNNDTTPYPTILAAYDAATLPGTVIKLRDRGHSWKP